MSAERPWIEANQARLLAGMAELRELLARHANPDADPDGAAAERARVEEQMAIAAMPSPAALDAVAESFGLSAFERRLLLLCAAAELDAEMGRLCATAQGQAGRGLPTFSLALAALPDPQWHALAPSSPLRFWRLIEVLPGDTLAASPLRIDERVLHHLVGLNGLDERVRPLIHACEPARVPPVSHRAIVDRLVSLWLAEGVGPESAVAELCGEDDDACRAIAANACAAAGMPLFLVYAADLPTSLAELDLLARLWEREAAFRGCTLLIDAHDDDRDALRSAALFAERLHCLVAVSARQLVPLRARVAISIDVPPPASSELADVWADALGDARHRLDGQVGDVVTQFRLDSDRIRAASKQVRLTLAAGGKLAPRLLWDACRVQARPRLDALAQRIEARATWDDLILPTAQKEILRQIQANVAQRATVYETWGFAERGGRGLGISAVFAGASGTGKTMAAEVLALELGLDLYRIDLSQVVSKYIGETEKNLARVFSAADGGGAVLLFDEADALFGKRSEVKDSHDRYANIEVSYLLQRMEAYRGLAILTTNRKSAIDPAFLRRLRFIVQFPFPDSTQRAEIWRRVFPTRTPTEGLDADRLAQLDVAGGHIRNIALNAAFLAAAAGEPVRMAHVRRAAQAEYAKLEKPITEAELAGWR
jgi:hypothetical protein